MDEHVFLFYYKMHVVIKQTTILETISFVDKIHY